MKTCVLENASECAAARGRRGGDGAAASWVTLETRDQSSRYTPAQGSSQCVVTLELLSCLKVPPWWSLVTTLTNNRGPAL